MSVSLQEEISENGCVNIFNSDRCLWSTLALGHSTREHGFKNSTAGDQHIFMSPDVDSCAIWWSHFEADVRWYFAVQHVSHALRQSPLRLPFSLTTYSHDTWNINNTGTNYEQFHLMLLWKSVYSNEACHWNNFEAAYMYNNLTKYAWPLSSSPYVPLYLPPRLNSKHHPP